MGLGSCGSFADWMRYAYWVGGRVRQIPSPYGPGGETGYTAQEDLKSISRHTMGEGRMIRVWFFHSCIPRPSLVFSQFSSVAQSCPTLCDPVNSSTPGLPVHHQLPEFTQTHVHRVSDAIQPSHPLSSPSPPAPNPSQHQNLFQ